ncbi:glycine zipper domain-containing protein [Ramlibacter pallidus]|uniref:DUF883 domain-containing protein n=1 Tax=Ramlibacter pallidus TaxID=2780087 RepID=A0ABR9S7L8_9BURK|nr:hypothetical protein [Ramlibacter pallidus]MBE7369483.1 hypothetical protein [Ramlibacter pallidus]
MNDIHPLDSTRKLASDALERASSTMRDLRSGVSDRASVASRYMGDYARTGKDYVAEHPLKSALVAAAVGAVVAGVVIALRHRRDNARYF